MSKDRPPDLTIPPETRQLFGPPPILSSEDPNRWWGLVITIAQSLKPKNPTDWMDVWDLVAERWEGARMRRLKPGILEVARRAKLEQRKNAKQAEDEREARFLESLRNWPSKPHQTGSSAARTRPEDAAATPKLTVPTEASTPLATVDADKQAGQAGNNLATLDEPATDLDYASAFMDSNEHYACADHIQTMAHKRYDAVLQRRAAYSEDLSRRPREVSGDIIDAEFDETERITQQGEAILAPTTVVPPVTASAAEPTNTPVDPTISSPQLTVPTSAVQLPVQLHIPQSAHSDVVSNTSLEAKGPAVDAASVKAPPRTLHAADGGKGHDRQSAVVGPTTGPDACIHSSALPPTGRGRLDRAGTGGWAP